MKTVKQLQLLSLAVMLLAVSACQSKPKDGLTDTYCCGRKFPAYRTGGGGCI